MEIGKMLVKIGADISDLEKKLKEAEDAVSSFEKVGETLTKNITAPLMAIGAVAYKAFLDVDEGLDTVLISSGAVGKELESLQQSVKNIARIVPSSFGEIGAVVGQLNTRFGVMDKTLERLSTQILYTAQMLGENAEQAAISFTKTINKFNVDISHATQLMDEFFVIGQRTGIGFTRLNDLLVAYGASLRVMGFDLRQSAHLLGEFERAGVNIEATLSALRIAMRQFVNAGLEPAEALQKTINSIKNAKDETKALEIGVRVFGRSATDMIDAIKSGRLDIDKLTEAMGNAKGAIERTFKDTADLPETFRMALNELWIALEPLGNDLNRLAQDVMPKLTSAVSKLVDVFMKLPRPIRNAIEVLAILAATIGPLLLLFAKLKKAIEILNLTFAGFNIMSTITQIGTFTGKVLLAIAAATMLTSTVRGLVDAFKSLGREFSWASFTSGFKKGWNLQIETIKESINDLLSIFDEKPTSYGVSGSWGSSVPSGTGASLSASDWAALSGGGAAGAAGAAQKSFMEQLNIAWQHLWEIPYARGQINTEAQRLNQLRYAQKTLIEKFGKELYANYEGVRKLAEINNMIYDLQRKIIDEQLAPLLYSEDIEKNAEQIIEIAKSLGAYVKTPDTYESQQDFMRDVYTQVYSLIEETAKKDLDTLKEYQMLTHASINRHRMVLAEIAKTPELQKRLREFLDEFESALFIQDIWKDLNEFNRLLQAGAFRSAVEAYEQLEERVKWTGIMQYLGRQDFKDIREAKQFKERVEAYQKLALQVYVESLIERFEAISLEYMRFAQQSGKDFSMYTHQKHWIWPFEELHFDQLIKLADATEKIWNWDMQKTFSEMFLVSFLPKELQTREAVQDFIAREGRDKWIEVVLGAGAKANEVIQEINQKFQEIFPEDELMNVANEYGELTVEYLQARLDWLTYLEKTLRGTIPEELMGTLEELTRYREANQRDLGVAIQREVTAMADRLTSVSRAAGLDPDTKKIAQTLRVEFEQYLSRIPVDIANQILRFIDSLEESADVLEQAQKIQDTIREARKAHAGNVKAYREYLQKQIEFWDKVQNLSEEQMILLGLWKQELESIKDVRGGLIGRLLGGGFATEEERGWYEKGLDVATGERLRDDLSAWSNLWNRISAVWLDFYNTTLILKPVMDANIETFSILANRVKNSKLAQWFTAAADAAKNFSRKLTDIYTRYLPSATMGRTGELLAGQAIGDLGIGSIIENALDKGWPAVLVELMSRSETWSQLMANLEPIIQSVADALGMMLEPLLPIAYTLGVILQPIFEALGNILSAVFMPILAALFPALKVLGIAMLTVAKVIGYVWNGIIEAFAKVFDALGNISILGAKPLAFMKDWARSFRQVKVDTDGLGDAIETLTDLTWDEAMARAKNIEELENATEALRNVPEGYKIALTRFQAAMGAVPAMATAGGPTTMATMASVTTVTSSPVNEVASTQQIIIQGDVYGWDDFKAKVDQANHELHRSAGMRRYGTAKGWGY